MNNIFFIVRNCGFFLFVKTSFQENSSYLAELTVLGTSVSWKTISKAGINKHSFTIVQVFELPSSTGPFEFPSKVVTSVQ